MPTPFDELGETGRGRRLRPLALAALRAWDLDVRRLRLVTNGYNAIFRVDTSSGPYALRVCLPLRTDGELRGELAWLRALEQAGVVRVPGPVPTGEGGEWAVASADGVSGSRRCVLFSWVPGRNLRKDDPPAMYERFGAAAAALHEHAAGWPRPRGLRHVDSLYPYPDEPPILFEQRLAPRVRAIYDRALVAGEAAFARVASERTIVVHHDMHPDNVKVSRTRMWIVDFDGCVLGTPAQDLGTSLFQMRIRGCPRERLAAFRRGYETVRAWPDEDLVRGFVAGAALTLANAVYQDFDLDYRREAGRYAARWARVAAEVLEGPGGVID